MAAWDVWDNWNTWDAWDAREAAQMVDEVAEAESGADHLCGPDSRRPKPLEAAPQCVAAVPPYSTRPAAHYPVACTRYRSQRAPSWAMTGGGG